VSRHGLITVALVVLAIPAFAACGGGSAATPGLREANAQGIRTYFAALKAIVAPLHGFPVHPEDHAEAKLILAGASRELAALMPPLEFQVSHDNLLHGLLAQMALIPKEVAAARSGSPAATAAVRSEDSREGRLIGAALAEAQQEIETCRADGFTC
jgi:hypothetical protein